MAEYIEREAVINRLMKVCMTDDIYGMGIQRGVDHAVDIVNEAKAADVAPVVHGKWKHYKNGIAYCSECEMEAVEDGTDYCPNCGCKMDGGESHEAKKRGTEVS